MKKTLILFIYVIIPNLILLSTSGHDYSSYTATSINTNLSGQTITNSNSDESAVYITQSGITITNSAISKSGDISDTENGEFYGENAAILVQGGGLTMTGGTITTTGKGANALVATNGGTVTISGTTITSTASSSARGLHATYGGTITASDVTISSTGGSCATLATDRGEGTVTCTGCTLSTSGAGSPLIYSTGSISVTDTTGTSSGAQAVVVEGKNSVSLDSSTLECIATPNNKDDSCGVLIYQSMSGDADSGTSSFTCKDSTIKILSSSSYANTAPMFFVTNTAANINLEDCTFEAPSGIFLKVSEGDWGSSGSNGGTVTLTLTDQEIEGDITVDSSSSLTINLVNSSIKGTINNDKSAAKLAIVMDADSSITLTGNSYYTSLQNSGSNNIDSGSYTFGTYDESESSSGSSGSNTVSTDRESGGPPSKNTDSVSSTSSTSKDDSNDSDSSSIEIITASFSQNVYSLKKLLFSIAMILSLFI